MLLDVTFPKVLGTVVPSVHEETDFCNFPWEREKKKATEYLFLQTKRNYPKSKLEL